MEKKTYGAAGYMDWVAQIPAGAAMVKVHFSGGALTQYGVTPAEYVTDNLFIQNVIEKSQYFKDGRIQLLNTIQISQKRQESGVKSQERAVEKRDSNEVATTEVTVSCLQDAQEYLQEHFGVPTYKVRSKVSAQAIAGEHGIEFKGI